MVRKLLALTGVTALTLVAAATLQARDYFYDVPAEPPAREAVNIRDLDLTTEEGVQKLERRINRAIDRVCPADGIGALVERSSVRQCREDAVASVRPQVDRAVAAAEDRQYRAYRAPGRWRDDGTPPPDRYAMRAPAPDHAWRGEDERRWHNDPAEARWRAGERALTSPPPAPPVAKQVADKPAPPPPGGRLVKRTVVTTTVTTTTSQGGPPSPPIVKKTVVVKRFAAPQPTGKWKGQRASAYARRPAVAGSWLPPVAWAASDRATLSAFRSGRLTRWRLTDRDGIARSGHITVGAARWVGGSPCRTVQAVKYQGGRQIVVASGTRCLAGNRLVNRAA